MPSEDPTPTTQPDPPSDSAQVLRPPAHRVERRAVYWWMLQSLVLGVPVIVAALIIGVIVEATRPVVVVVVALAVVLTLVTVLIAPFWRYRVHRWEATEHAVYARTGWLVVQWRAAPLSRVQTVDAVQGPLEQLLGLSTLRVTTASSSGAVEIGGLSRTTADRVSRELTEITEQIPGDAT